MKTRLEKFIRWGLYLSLLLPLGFTGWTRLPAHFGKTIIFQMLVEVLALLYLISVISRYRHYVIPTEVEGSSSITARDPSTTLRSARDDKWWIRIKKGFMFHACPAPCRRLWCGVSCFKTIDWSILLFLIILVITSLTGVNWANSFWGNQSRAQGVFTWLHFGAWYFLLRAVFFCHPALDAGSSNAGSLDSRVRGNDNSKTLYPKPSTLYPLIITNAVAFLVTLTALLQPWLKFGFILDHQIDRLSGIFGNPAFLASYLILAATLAFYSAYQIPNTKYQIPLFALGLLELFTLYRTGTRGALIGVIVGAVFFFIILALAFWRKAQVRSKTKIFLLLLVILATGVIIFTQVPSSKFQVPSLPATAQTRLWAWQIALKGWQDQPLLGWGPGNFEVPFNKYYNPRFLKYSFAETVWDKPHNWPLEILVTSGLVGLIAYLWLYGALLKATFKFRSSNFESNSNFQIFKIDSKFKIQNYILFSGLVAYFVQNLFLFETSNTLLLFFFIAALISSSRDQQVSAKKTFAQGERARCPEGASEPERERNFFAGKIDSVFACGYLLVALLLLFSLYLNYQTLRASYYLVKSEAAGLGRGDFNDWSIFVSQALQTREPWGAETAITAASDLHELDRRELISSREDLQSAATLIVSRLEELIEKYPDNALYPLWLGRVYVILGDKLDAKYLDAGEKVLLKAQALAPTRQEIYMLLGRLYLIKKDFAKAIEAQRQAVALLPEIGEAHWFLGLSLVAAGERQSGLKEIELAWQLSSGLKNVNNTLYVIDLLAEEKKYDRVLELYQFLSEREPDNPNWYVKLAATYAALGNQVEALKAVNQAVLLAPQIKEEAEKFIRENKLK